jgi:hypothetical protein
VQYFSVFLTTLFFATACNRESLYGGGGFSQNVHDSFADCSEAEIHRLAMSHNIQTAFGRCGSNRFSHYQWSPDGIHLYFQLTHGAHVLNGQEKTITTIPLEGPTARAAWLQTDILAIPLPAVEGGTEERMAIYNWAAHTVDFKSLPVREPQDLMAYQKGRWVLFTALDDQDVRRPYQLDTNTGEVVRALPWLEQAVVRLSISEPADLVAWSTASDTELSKLTTGESLHLFPGVTRAVPHDDGRWVALETDGAEISHFDQRSWNEVSAKARERELARQKKWLERQPDWVETSTRPPELQMFDLTNGKRYRVTSFWGDEVQWYPSAGNYLAFIIWGIEGKQVNRNIGLTSMAERFRMIDADQIPMGIERVVPAKSTETLNAH